MSSDVNTIAVVTIDGPSGVGKSTVSKRVAAELGYAYLDTGAMYRAVGIYLKDLGVDFGVEEDVAAQLPTIVLELLPAVSMQDDTGVVINGIDVSSRIRTPEASMIASDVSAIGVVRTKLTELQRALGEKGKIVAEGRDMGTVVFPQAKNKFFLDARAEIRAERRFKQLKAKGESPVYEEILEQTVIRDKNDSEREIAPLKQAEDALYVDTSDKTLEEVSASILQKL